VQGAGCGVQCAGFTFGVQGYDRVCTRVKVWDRVEGLRVKEFRGLRFRVRGLEFRL